MIARMRNLLPPRFYQFICLFITSLLLLTLSGCKTHFTGLLDPKGIIAYQERKILFDTLALMLIVVLPVIVMSFTFIYHYQISHRVRDYKPNWSHSYFLESIWWGVPCAIIVILAVITWKKTHELDPYRPIPGTTQPPLIVQAIALPWKWLFIYPEQHIATINHLEIPVNRQIEFWLTTDNVPMSAIFIPQIGSQIYAMAGMRTRLHLLANEIGTYNGLNTQYNGGGFSDMNFPVYVVSEENMQSWLKQVKKSSPPLTDKIYAELLKPTDNNKAEFYSAIPPDLFNQVIALYEHTFGPTHPRGKENSMTMHKE